MASDDLVGAVRANPIETVSGLILVVGGGALNLALEGSTAVKFVGYVTSTVGTLLISWALTRAWVSKQQDDALTRNLRLITRPLSTVASQLNQALYRALQDQTEDRDTHVLEASVQHLFGVLSELQLLIGSPISVDDIVAIKDRLDMLGEELEAASHEPSTEGVDGSDGDAKQRVVRALEEVQNIKLQLESAVARDRTYTQEGVECPSCKTKWSVRLGSLAGDSATGFCTPCAERFHVHRAADGKVISIPWGGPGSASLKVACPKCGSQVPLTVPRERATVQIRFCLHCFSKLQIDPTNHQVTILREPEQPLDGALQTDDEWTFIACPKCSQLRKTIFFRNGTYYAVCPTDDKLLRVSGAPPAATTSAAATVPPTAT